LNSYATLIVTLPLQIDISKNTYGSPIAKGFLFPFLSHSISKILSEACAAEFQEKGFPDRANVDKIDFEFLR
jgi:hypothetical protein